MVAALLASALSLSGCMSTWQPRAYLATDESACTMDDLDCTHTAHGTYGCGPSGCGTPVRTRVAK